MNIALITNNYKPNRGGIANVMINVSERLRELGETVYIFNKSYSDEEKLCYKILSNDTSLKGVFIHHFKFYYFLFYLFFKILFFFKGFTIKNRFKLVFFYCFYLKFIVRRIISIKNLVNSLKKHKIDVILSGASNIPLLYSFIISKWFKIPLVTIAHGDDFLVRHPYNINTFIFQNIQKIIVTNEIMRKLFLKVHDVKPDRVKIIHLGVDPNNCQVTDSISNLRAKFNFSNNDFIILTVSRFYPRKGIETILKALRLFINENKEIPMKYLIIGGGIEQKKIESLITQLNLEKYVTMLGDVDDSIKNQYYKLSDLFILVPELKKNSIEGFGIVYLEANFFQLPVIGSRTGGVKLAILNGKTGFLIEPKDESNLKNKIMLLYGDEQLRRNLGEYGHQRILKSYNWRKNILTYQEVLVNCIENYYKEKN